MLSYELSKKLKEMGFWQNGDGKFLMRENADGSDGEYDSFNNRTMSLKFFGEDYKKKHPEFIVYIPTLSELIEACGDEFVYLRRDAEKDWWARRRNGDMTISCNSPEEAVANLFISLNSKDETSSAQK